MASEDQSGRARPGLPRAAAGRSATSRASSPSRSAAASSSACSSWAARTWSGAIVGKIVVPALDEGQRATPALLVAGRASRCWRSACSRWSASSAAGSAPATCSSGCRPATGGGSPGRYLELPLAWHHRHATGTLLSNANSDVEAAWFPIAPLPFAVGTIVMLVARDRLAVLHRLGARPGRRWPSSRRCSASTSSTRAGWRRGRPAPSSCAAEVSAIAHESFDGALVVKTMGREARRDRRGSARGPASCATR